MSEFKTKLSEVELNEIYLWVDTFKLSRPKKNINRDFSDGVLMAEVIHWSFPKMIDLHNYFPANNFDRKMINWRLLNKKVFIKIGLHLKDSHFEALSNANPNCIECLLWHSKQSIENYK